MTMISAHIITGFLGVGKTSLLKSLIDQKPPNEQWGIIVNEFGELGVDALLLNNDTITIKQVAGGCACCAALMPFQVALNQLLKMQKFDRLFVEPSGLGHGDKLAQLLEEEQYKKWLTLNGVITLVDPQQFSQDKYRNHDIYLRQLQVADAIVMSKVDLASESDINRVESWAETSKLPTYVSEHGNLPLDCLSDIKHSSAKMLFRPVVKDNSGYYTQGIQFPFEITFDQSMIIEYFKQACWSRIKGFIHTNKGWLQLNISDDVFDVIPSSPKEQSIIEIIHDQALPASVQNELASLYTERNNDI